MVDHPLVAEDLRQYIVKNKIEEALNVGLNEVLSTMPQDPFSQLAATLIDVSALTNATPTRIPYPNIRCFPLLSPLDCTKTTCV